MTLWQRLKAWFTDLTGIEVTRDPVPAGPFHIYTQPLSTEEWAYGEDVCLYCGRKDIKRTKYTDPRCTKRGGPLSLYDA